MMMTIIIILNAIFIIIIITVGIWVMIMYAMEGWPPPIQADAFDSRTLHNKVELYWTSEC